MYHRSFSVIPNLSVYFRQTTCQKYTNSGVFLEELHEPFRVSLNARMSWFPVVVTGIKAPQLTQKLPFAFLVTLCLENLLELVLPRFDDSIG